MGSAAAVKRQPVLAVGMGGLSGQMQDAGFHRHWRSQEVVSHFSAGVAEAQCR